MNEAAPHANRRWIIAGVVSAAVVLIVVLALALNRSKTTHRLVGSNSFDSPATTSAAPPTANPGGAGPTGPGASGSGPNASGNTTTPAGGGFSATATVGGPQPTGSGTKSGPHASSAAVVKVVSGSKELRCPSTSAQCSAKPGDDLRIEVESQRWKTITEVCFKFTFSADLLDHGEDLELSNAGGFVNNGTTEPSRTFCITPASAPQAIAALRDGRELLDVWMMHGAVQIGSVTVSIKGTPA
jgi:hypothetical protein